MLIEKVKAYIAQWQMLPPGSHVLAGVSGGADSVCLLLVLNHLQQELSIRVSAVHVHHGIRGAEADADAAYTEALCRQLGVACVVVERDVPALVREQHLSVEEAARKIRYEAFTLVAGQIQATHIAVAHHAEDQEETILMHLFRGCGLAGAAGIQPVNGQIVRPLLGVSRAEIEGFLRTEGIAWQTDSTNGETAYTRNFIRHELMPLLSARFPQAGEQLRQFAALSGEADRYLRTQAEQLLKQWGGVSKRELCRIDPALQPYVFRLAMEQAGIPAKDVTAVHYRMLAGLCEKPVGHRIVLPAGYEAYAAYEQLVFRKRAAPCTFGKDNGSASGAGTDQEQAFEETKRMMSNDDLRAGAGRNGKAEPVSQQAAAPPPLAMRIFPYEKRMKIPQNAYTKWFDYDKITEEVCVRTRQTGDRFSPLPDGGKKLKDYMIDAKIPREERDQIWLLASGSQILWIIGHRISEAYKVTGETRQILEVTVEGEPVETC